MFVPIQDIKTGAAFTGIFLTLKRCVPVYGYFT